MSLLIKVPTIDIAAIKARTDNLPVDPASEAGNIAAVRAKTDALPADPASDTNVAAVGAEATAIKAKTDTIVWADITDIKDESLGKWLINKTTNVMTFYKADGVTVLRQYNLTDNVSVSERVPI